VAASTSVVDVVEPGERGVQHRVLVGNVELVERQQFHDVVDTHASPVVIAHRRHHARKVLLTSAVVVVVRMSRFWTTAILDFLTAENIYKIYNSCQKIQDGGGPEPAFFLLLAVSRRLIVLSH